MKVWLLPFNLVFHSRGINKINHLHEVLLRIVYKYNISSFEDLLKRDRSFTIHQRNIKSLAIELFKVKGNLSNNIKSFFKLENKIKIWGYKLTLLVFLKTYANNLGFINAI